ncbi:MAG: family 43 glycosylhydrolase, partial [Clostridia bacterium]|nr:family 43 glycosylhydrolase [Clostridia bacterium]
KGQVITLAVMENPWTISDRRIRLSFPRYNWETKGKTEGKDERVNEGPVFLLHNGKLCVVYSASGCWSEYYCLGLIEFNGSDFSPAQIMNKANWVKHSEPIFKAANEVYGVGHCTFFTSPDGSETWIAYHGMATPDAGESNRFMYAQPITFDENNFPVIGDPYSRDTEIGVPSGEK